MKLVLDTNVVIDWLVFDDAFLASFREQVRAGSIRVITHAPALDELRRVLGYPILKLSVERQAAVFEQYAALSVLFDGGQAATAEAASSLAVAASAGGSLGAGVAAASAGGSLGPAAASAGGSLGPVAASAGGSLGAAARSASGSWAELPPGFPRCRDSDDDPFLHLAWRAGADALVSRDKAVLKLARKARKFGFEIYDVPKMVAMLGASPSVMTSSTQLSSSS